MPVSFNSNNLENVLVEINLRKKKWLLVCCYNCQIDDFKDLINDLTNVTLKILCIEPKYFQNSATNETGLSGLHENNSFENLLQKIKPWINCLSKVQKFR